MNDVFFMHGNISAKIEKLFSCKTYENLKTQTSVTFFDMITHLNFGKIGDRDIETLTRNEVNNILEEMNQYNLETRYKEVILLFLKKNSENMMIDLEHYNRIFEKVTQLKMDILREFLNFYYSIINFQIVTRSRYLKITCGNVEERFLKQNLVSNDTYLSILRMDVLKRVETIIKLINGPLDIREEFELYEYLSQLVSEFIEDYKYSSDVNVLFLYYFLKRSMQVKKIREIYFESLKGVKNE